jgi:hypothetical protein
MPQVPYELTQGLNVVNPGIREGVDVKTYPNLQAEQMVESGTQMVRSGTNLKIMMDQVMLDRAEAEAKGHDSAIGDAIRSALYDSDNGFITTAGVDALNKKQEMVKRIAGIVKDGAAKASSPLVAQIVQRAGSQRQHSALNVIDHHAFAQGKVYEAAESVASAESLRADLVAAVVNGIETPEAMQAKRQAMQNQVDSHAVRMGLVNKNGELDRSNPVYIAMNNGISTKTHQEVIQNLIVKDQPQVARSYFDAYVKPNQSKIEPSAFNGMEGLIKTGAVRKESLDIYASMAKRGLSPAAQKNELKILYEKGLGAETYDSTLARIDKGEADGIQQRQQWRNGTLDAGLKWLSQNPMKSIADLPPQLKIDLIKSGNYGTLENAMAKGGVQTNPETYSMLVNSMTSNRAEFLKTNLQNFQGELSPQHLLGFIDKQAALRAGNQKAADSTDTLKQGLASIAADLKSVNINTSPKPGSDAAKKYAEFTNQYSLELDAATTTKGLPLTGREAKDIGRSLLKEVFERGSWFETKYRRYETIGKPGNFIAAKYDDMPSGSRSLIEKEMAQTKFTSEEARRREVERLHTIRSN